MAQAKTALFLKRIVIQIMRPIVIQIKDAIEVGVGPWLKEI